MASATELTFEIVGAYTVVLTGAPMEKVLRDSDLLGTLPLDDRGVVRVRLTTDRPTMLGELQALLAMSGIDVRPAPEEPRTYVGELRKGGVGSGVGSGVSSTATTVSALRLAHFLAFNERWIADIPERTYARLRFTVVTAEEWCRIAMEWPDLWRQPIAAKMFEAAMEACSSARPTTATGDLVDNIAAMLKAIMGPGSFMRVLASLKGGTIAKIVRTSHSVARQALDSLRYTSALHEKIKLKRLAVDLLLACAENGLYDQVSQAVLFIKELEWAVPGGHRGAATIPGLAQALARGREADGTRMSMSAGDSLFDACDHNELVVAYMERPGAFDQARFDGWLRCTIDPAALARIVGQHTTAVFAMQPEQAARIARALLGDAGGSARLLDVMRSWATLDGPNAFARIVHTLDDRQARVLEAFAMAAPANSMHMSTCVLVDLIATVLPSQPWKAASLPCYGMGAMVARVIEACLKAGECEKDDVAFLAAKAGGALHSRELLLMVNMAFKNRRTE